jgi:hypothetical protein
LSLNFALCHTSPALLRSRTGRSGRQAKRLIEPGVSPLAKYLSSFSSLEERLSPQRRSRLLLYDLEMWVFRMLEADRLATPARAHVKFGAA